MRQTDQDLSRVREFLAAQSLRPQQRLPAERDLAHQLSLTRNRLRGALRRLETEGLIWRHVGQGTFFGAKPPRGRLPHDDEAIGDSTNPGEILEARLALEPELARLAALRATAPDIAKMEDCARQMTAAENWSIWTALDYQLHRMIARSAGNTLLLVLFDTIFASRTPTSWGRLHENPRAQLRRTAATNEHVAIVQSIRDRDPDMAAKHMSDHLSAVRNVLLGPHRANAPTDSSNEADLAIGAT